MLFRNTANDKVQLVAIQIADNLAVVGYGCEYARSTVLRAYAGNYVEFQRSTTRRLARMASLR
jgi:hypothetical protein